MKGRRKSRYEALQILYELEIKEGLNTQALSQFESHFSSNKETDPFTQRLVEGVLCHLKEIDSVLGNFSKHWRMDRMPVIDRNILRIGIFELSYCEDIPATVSINEMVELAKRFGSEDSSRFINGVLDEAKATLVMPSKAP